MIFKPRHEAHIFIRHTFLSAVPRRPFTGDGNRYAYGGFYSKFNGLLLSKQKDLGNLSDEIVCMGLADGDGLNGPHNSLPPVDQDLPVDLRGHEGGSPP